MLSKARYIQYLTTRLDFWRIAYNDFDTWKKRQKVKDAERKRNTKRGTRNPLP